MKTYYAIVDKKFREVVYGATVDKVPFLALFESISHARAEKRKNEVFYKDCVVVKVAVSKVK